MAERESPATAELRRLLSTMHEALTENVREIKNSVVGVKDDVEELAGKVGTVSTQVSNLATEMEPITEAFRGGGGRDGLPTRMAIIEGRLRDLEKKDEIAAGRRWQLWLAIISSMLALLTSLALMIAKTMTASFHP